MNKLFSIKRVVGFLFLAVTASVAFAAREGSPPPAPKPTPAPQSYNPTYQPRTAQLNSWIQGGVSECKRTAYRSLNVILACATDVPTGNPEESRLYVPQTPVAVAPTPTPREEPVVAPLPEPTPQEFNVVELKDAKKIIVTMSADALFAFDKSSLQPTGKKTLDDLVDFLKDINYTGMLVVGHTDRFGSDAYNQGLSERRAKTVKAYLVTSGLDADMIKIEGHGKKQPVTKVGDCPKGDIPTEKLKACHQSDRRVEVFIDGQRTVSKEKVQE